VTSPDGFSNGDTLSYLTIHQLQDVDPENPTGGGANPDMQNLLGQVAATFINNLMGGFADIPDAIGEFLGEIVEIFTGNEDGDLNDLGTWVHNILQLFGLSKSQASNPGLDIIGAAGNFIDSILNPTGKLASNAGVQSAITQAQAAAAAVAAQGAQVQAVKAAVLSFQDGLPLEPFSHSMTNSIMTFDRVDVGVDEAFQVQSGTTAGASNTTARQSIYTSWKSGDGNTANGSGSNTFTTIFNREGMFLPAANSVYGGFIRARWGGLRESFTFMVGPVSSPCSFAYIVGTMDEANGNITVAAYSGDISSTIGNSEAEVTPAIPDGVVLSDRETVFCAIHQYGAGNVRPLYGKRLGGAPRDGLLFPAKPNARFGRSTPFTAGSVINASDLLFDDPNLPWVGVGLSLILPVPEPTNYYEDFDTGVIPSTMVRRSTQPAAIFSGNFGSEGSNDGERNYQITKRLNRDNHYVQGQIITPTAQPAFLGLRADSSGNNRTVMAVTSSGVSIRRRGASSDTLASASFTVTSGEVYRMIAAGNVYSIYRVTVDEEGDEVLGSPLCQYVDDADALPRGVGNRWTTLGVTRNFFVVSGLWSYVFCADIPD
jgi:hypothetical protein